ncbi:MAG: 2OG-Fe(II) oxygenase [Burkholderiales bacterium]|nr:2OG-Fe(II) oxygenase [Burkholderiales bacterium]
MAAPVQTVTEDLRRWIVAQAESGCRPEDVIAAMRASGWAADVAAAALEQTLERHLAQRGAARPAIVKPAAPGPAADAATTQRLSDGCEVRILARLQLPRVVVFGGLLAEAECRQLVELARPRLSRSETVDNSTGGSEVNAARTSDGMFFTRGEHPLIATLEQRIAELLRWPVDHGEGLQILRYRPGAEYRPHYDYFDPKHPGTMRVLERGGQRVGTLVLYLDTPESGGATTFPDAGFEVAAQRGNAVFFGYDRPDPSSRTLHGGAPVVAGEKWVATKWLRERVFT